MIRAIKAHITGDLTTEHGKRPDGAPWIDGWSDPDGPGRSISLRPGGLTAIWSSPKPTTATPAPAADTVEHNYGNAAAIRAAKIAEYHKAMTDGALGNALPDAFGPCRVVLADATIVERR